MGTQPSRKQTKRGRKQTRQFKDDLSKHIGRGDYKKAAFTVSNASSVSKNSNYITGILSAGLSAYKTSKTSNEQVIKKVSGNSVSQISSRIKKNLDLADKDSIRQALYDTLANRGSK